jgi:hypothetical protein
MSLAVQSAIDPTKPLHNASLAIDTEAPFCLVDTGWDLVHMQAKSHPESLTEPAFGGAPLGLSANAGSRPFAPSGSVPVVRRPGSPVFRGGVDTVLLGVHDRWHDLGRVV